MRDKHKDRSLFTEGLFWASVEQELETDKPFRVVHLLHTINTCAYYLHLF